MASSQMAKTAADNTVFNVAPYKTLNCPIIALKLVSLGQMGFR